MKTTLHVPSSATGKRSSGPQGTRLFSAEELSQFAVEVDPPGDGRASVDEPVLEGVQGQWAGRRFSLRPGRQTVGRAKSHDVIVDDLSVSSTHAWIVNQQGHYVIINTLSTNGTFVNNVRIHEAVIKHGDRIRFGQVEFVFLTRELRKRVGTHLTWLATGLVVIAGLLALAWWLT